MLDDCIPMGRSCTLFRRAPNSPLLQLNMCVCVSVGQEFRFRGERQAVPELAMDGVSSPALSQGSGNPAGGRAEKSLAAQGRAGSSRVRCVRFELREVDGGQAMWSREGQELE